MREGPSRPFPIAREGPSRSSPIARGGFGPLSFCGTLLLFLKSNVTLFIVLNLKSNLTLNLNLNLNLT